MPPTAYRFPGVEIKARLFRHYPKGELASHAIGHIGRINEADLDRLEEADDMANYRGTDHIGKLGIEQSYEKQLHGITGFEQVETDAGGRALRTLSRRPPVSGNNLTLTIDSRLQEVAEQAFGQYRGALVAIDPKSGEVLAFVSKPGFDPNLFIDGIDPVSWDALNNSLDKPLNNRALRGQYPPGSTFKPFMALAGLELGKRTPSYTISDPGFFTLPGNAHRYRDWKAGGHGWWICTNPSSFPATLTTTAWPTIWGRTTSSTSSASSASARKPASTSRAKPPACCPRATGK